MSVICFYDKSNKPWDSRTLADIFYGITPQVAHGPRLLFADISSCSSLYSLDEFLQKAEVLFSKFGLFPLVGVSDDPSFARIQAELGTLDSKRMPLDMLPLFLDPFVENTLTKSPSKNVSKDTHKDRRLELRKLVEYLQHLGIFDVDGFLHLSSKNLKDLVARFGTLTVLLNDRISKRRPILWPFFKPDECIFEQEVFDQDVQLEYFDQIIFIVKRLLDRIFLRLQARGLGLRSFELRLVQENLSFISDPVYKIPIELAPTQTSVTRIMEILREQVSPHLTRNQKNPIEVSSAERARSKGLIARVCGIEIFVKATFPMISYQKDLFDPKKEETQQAYSNLIHRLSNRLGSQNVFKIAIQENYMPEKIWSRIPATGNNMDPSNNKDLSHNKMACQIRAPKCSASAADDSMDITNPSSEQEQRTVNFRDFLPIRPLRLLTEPIRLPCQSANAKELCFQDEVIDLNDIQNHEIIFSDWWSGQLERVYFQAKSSSGQRLWLFKSGGSYFLHGVFD